MGFRLGQKIIDRLRGKKNRRVSSKKSEWYLSTSGKIGDDEFPICLSDNERDFLVNNISNSINYLEFGSGGSTYLALTRTSIPNILSIESDKQWILHLKQWDVISSNTQRLNFMHIDIGKTGEWGVPTDESKKELFPNFSSSPFADGMSFDTIFIDGRFRVACALQAVLHSNLNTKILMHDFNNRPEYHVILDFLDIVDTADTMALFRIKENYDKEKLIQIYDKYKYIYE